MASLFQALTLAFWRFQGLAATTLFTAVLQAIEARARAELEAAHPGRFRHKGQQPRQWHLPFGRVQLSLVKLWDRVARRTVCPLKEALDLPSRVRWCDETLLPGYRLAVIQSFRQSQKAVRGMAPDGRVPSHHTLHRRFPTPPKVLVSDGEEGIPQALAGPETLHQRCLVHARRGLPFALYQDGFEKAGQEPIKTAFERIPGLQLCQAELARLDPTEGTVLQELLVASERAFAAIKRKLPAERFPHTRRYVLGLIEDGLTYLRHLLATGQTLPLSINRLESIWSRVLLRLKQIGRRWSPSGALHMLAACLVHALHPERYAAVEAAVRGDDRPQVSILITSLETAWAS